MARFATRGVRLMNSFAPSSVCSPSRHAIFLSRNVGSIRARDNPGGTGDRELEETTFVNVLQNHGYATGYCGKWGLGHKSGAPWNRGFSSFLGQMTHQDAHWKYPHHLVEFRDNSTSVFHLKGNVGHVFTEHNCAKNPHSTCTYVNDVYRTWAMDFIRSAPRPFFLFWSPTHSHAGVYNENDHHMISPTKKLTPWRDNDNEENQSQRGHASEIEQHMDEDIRFLLEEVVEKKEHANTLVIVTSDNGAQAEMVGYSDPFFFDSSAGLRGWKRSMYQGGFHVPTMVAWPSTIRANSALYAMHSLYDFGRTILHAAGLNHTDDDEVLRNRGPGNEQGGAVSLLEWWASGDDAYAPERDWLHLEICFSHVHDQCKSSTIGLRGITKNWKLLYDYEKKDFELFDLIQNPLEKNSILMPSTTATTQANNNDDMIIRRRTQLQEFRLQARTPLI